MPSPSKPQQSRVHQEEHNFIIIIESTRKKSLAYRPSLPQKIPKSGLYWKKKLPFECIKKAARSIYSLALFLSRTIGQFHIGTIYYLHTYISIHISTYIKKRKSFKKFKIETSTLKGSPTKGQRWVGDYFFNTHFFALQKKGRV